MSAAAAARDHVTFRVAHQWLGLPVSAVQEVLVAQRLAPVPLAPSAVAGFLNLRGQIVTAVDLRTGLSGPRGALAADPAHDAPTEAPFDVVVRHDDELFALLVDEVGDVLPFSARDVADPPPTVRDPWRAVCAGAVRRAHDVLLVLDLPRLLQLPIQPTRAA